ncbi:MAG: hypothetical protein JWP75_2674 [Frondihabitans sp.]|nr:hypothetical protein [Frondihabitans sp.]
MGMRTWLTLRRMSDPVPGTFVKVDEYFPHPGRVPMQTMLTGYVEADGVPRTQAEVLQKPSHAFTDTLPVTVDRTNPTVFVVRWNESHPSDGGAARAKGAAQAATEGE